MVQRACPEALCSRYVGIAFRGRGMVRTGLSGKTTRKRAATGITRFTASIETTMLCVDAKKESVPGDQPSRKRGAGEDKTHDFTENIASYRLYQLSPNSPERYTQTLPGNGSGLSYRVEPGSFRYWIGMGFAVHPGPFW